MIEERFLLAKERIGAVEKEAVLEQRFQAYFGRRRLFLEWSVRNMSGLQKEG